MYNVEQIKVPLYPKTLWWRWYTQRNRNRNTYMLKLSVEKERRNKQSKRYEKMNFTNLISIIHLKDFKKKKMGTQYDIHEWIC